LHDHYRVHGGSQIDSIAVLPFGNIGGDLNSDYLTDGADQIEEDVRG
jgi:TolB-like protein